MFVKNTSSKMSAKIKTTISELRQRLQKNNRKRKKIKVDNSGRRKNIYRASIEELQYALERDQFLVEKTSTQSKNNLVQAVGNEDCTQKSSKDTVSVNVAFRKLFRQFKKVDVNSFLQSRAGGGLIAFDPSRTVTLGPDMTKISTDNGILNICQKSVILETISDSKSSNTQPKFSTLQHSSRLIQSSLNIPENGPKEKHDVLIKHNKVNVYTFKDLDGFFMIPNPFTAEQLSMWKHQLLKVYPKMKGHRSNLTHRYLKEGIVEVAQQHGFVSNFSTTIPAKKSNLTGSNSIHANIDSKNATSKVDSDHKVNICAHSNQVDQKKRSVLNQFGSRLSWLTFGYHFNWTLRTYSRQQVSQHVSTKDFYVVDTLFSSKSPFMQNITSFSEECFR